MAAFVIAFALFTITVPLVPRIARAVYITFMLSGTLGGTACFIGLILRTLAAAWAGGE